MTLIFAFGICFQMPVILTLLGQAGHHRFAVPDEKRRYAIVIVFVIAAVLTPPDVISPARPRAADAPPLRGLDLLGAHGREEAAQEREAAAAAE